MTSLILTIYEEFMIVVIPMPELQILYMNVQEAP